MRDLRANDLQCYLKMRGDRGHRCCLCVALDTAYAMGFIAPEGYDERDDGMPPFELADFYGWGSRDPMLVDPNGEITTAQEMNDGIGYAVEFTHKQIADAFERTYPALL